MNKVVTNAPALALLAVLATAGLAGAARLIPGAALMPVVRHVLPGVSAGIAVGEWAVRNWRGDAHAG